MALALILSGVCIVGAIVGTVAGWALTSLHQDLDVEEDHGQDDLQ